MRILSAALFVVAVIFGNVEFSRWKQPQLFGELTKGQKVRRAVTFAALLIVLAGAFLGTYLPNGHISKHLAAVEITYWAVIVLMVLIMPIVAVREMRVTLKQAAADRLAAERREALEDAVQAMAKAEERAELPHRNGNS